MAEVPDVRVDRLPVPVTAPGHLFGNVHRFGVAHELDLIRQGFVPPPRTPRIRTRSRRRRPAGPVRRWLAASGPADVWHRLRCRTGRHQFRFRLDGRRCRWCDEPEPEAAAQDLP